MVKIVLFEAEHEMLTSFAPMMPLSLKAALRELLR